MLRKFVLCSVLAYTAYASSFDEYKNKTTSDFSKEKSQFSSYYVSLKKEFQDYKKAQQKIYKEYKKELSRYWYKPILTTKKVLVNYSKDKKSRTIIDFATNKLIIETLAENEQEAQNTIKVALAKAITTDTKTFYENNELEQRLSNIKLPKEMMSAKIDSKPILSTVIFKKQPTKESVRIYVNKNINLQTIKNPTSRLYCTIAAYNTGAGNVARAFVRTNSTALAAKKINQLTPDEVYSKLLRDLKYDEPKHYLIKVRKQMLIYEKIYKS